LAAFVDGEGSIFIRSDKATGHLALEVSISNTDPRLTVWLRETFGGPKCSGEPRFLPNKKAKKFYQWSLRSKHAEEIVLGVYPWLLLKKQQAEIAIAFRRTFSDGRNQSNPLTSLELTVREDLRSKIRVLNKRGAA